MKENDFQELIDKRLEENRVVLDSSPMPSWLKPAAAYLGFHTFRALVILSMIVVVILYVFFYEWLMMISRYMFGVSL